MPIIGGTGPIKRGSKVSIKGDQAPIIGGSGAHYRGVRYGSRRVTQCPLDACAWCSQILPRAAPLIRVGCVTREADVVGMSD